MAIFYPEDVISIVSAGVEKPETVVLASARVPSRLALDMLAASRAPEFIELSPVDRLLNIR
jgi:hypothetical protein